MKSNRSKSKDQVQKNVKCRKFIICSYRNRIIILVRGIIQRGRSYIQRKQLTTNKFFVEQTKDKQIKYIVDRNVLREQQIIDVKVQPEIMRNLEQVKYLKWEGELGMNKKNGMLFGEELIYILEENIYEIYNIWDNIIMERNKENGSFNLNIQTIFKNIKKQGEDHMITSQTILEGDYVQGKKQGKWTIKFRLNEKNRFKIFYLSVEGYLEEEELMIFKEEKMANGEIQIIISRYKLIILSFTIIDNQMIDDGEYKNGKRKGKWIAKYRYQINEPFTQIQYGEGIYDDSEIKNGRMGRNFLKLSKFMQSDFGQRLFKRKQKREMVYFIRYQEKQNFIQIGGGTYDEKGFQNGQWSVLTDNFKMQTFFQKQFKLNNSERKLFIWQEIRRMGYTLQKESTIREAFMMKIVSKMVIELIWIFVLVLGKIKQFQRDNIKMVLKLINFKKRFQIMSDDYKTCIKLSKIKQFYKLQHLKSLSYKGSNQNLYQNFLNI
ncbi:unnamed protein product [Paramecium sonneborni]|uniref:Uncharacterized protein n=1 Tax=Paramecium sonneborni TaxID=65129 RepID=A0A8S1NTT6_9CILI|nr:unnamed protein product [Paramecium sonneborni]